MRMVVVILKHQSRFLKRRTSFGKIISREIFSIVGPSEYTQIRKRFQKEGMAMKSRKEIAELANEYIAEFDAAYAPKNERIERIIAYGKKSLEERQIAPQTIMDKCVRAIYEVVLKQKITVGDEASCILKKMEKLSRERSLLPFRRYDPWD